VARKTFHARALVLDKTKLGETDNIVTLLSADGSLIRAVAKGARKPGSRMSARTELFCEFDGLFAEGRSLAIVTDAELLDTHPGLRGDYEKTCAACVVAEVARLTSYEDAEEPVAYAMASAALSALERCKDGAHVDLLTAAYAVKIMSVLGWQPELDGCIACGEPDVGRISAHAGGVLCESCARDIEGAEPLDEALLAWLRALIGFRFDDLLGQGIDANTAWRLLRFAAEWASVHLDTRLRSAEFLLGGIG
jgi:DNA repair protein RecO (recombination protein O)